MTMNATTSRFRSVAKPEMKLGRFASFVSLILLLLLPACNTTSGGSRALKQIDISVSWPMTRFRNAVAAGAVTRAEQDQVNTAYANYQAAYAKALEAAHDNRDAAAPADVQTFADQVTAAIAAIPF